VLAAMRFDFAESFRYYPPLFPLVGLAGAYVLNLISLSPYFGKKSANEKMHKRISLCICFIAIAIMLGVYAYRMATMYPSQIPPMVYNDSCFLQQIVRLFE
jgi:hypothetical protein